jgi:hypothetical protein
MRNTYCFSTATVVTWTRLVFTVYLHYLSCLIIIAMLMSRLLSTCSASLVTHSSTILWWRLTCAWVDGKCEQWGKARRWSQLLVQIGEIMTTEQCNCLEILIIDDQTICYRKLLLLLCDLTEFYVVLCADTVQRPLRISWNIHFFPFVCKCRVSFSNVFAHLWLGSG